MTHLVIPLVLATILLPIAGGMLTIVLPRSASKRTGQFFIGLGFAALLLLAYQFTADGKIASERTIISFGGAEIIGFAVDTVSVLVAVAVVGIGLLIAIYSGGYLDPGNREHPDIVRRRYFAYLSLFVGAMAGLVFSSTVLGQLVFFEITGLCSWGLIGYYELPTSFDAAAKALIITHIGSLGLYAAAAVLFLQTHSFALSGIATLGEGAKTFVLLAVLFAAWAKSAQLPFHMWLPDAMAAPTPVSAYLHAASMVKVGIYIFARALLSANGAPEIVGYACTIMATLTLVFGFFMYLPQTDMKRLLAYSTITQLAYMLLGLGLSVFGSRLAFNGAIAHLFNHAFAKTLFFLVAGSLSYTTGTRMLALLRGVLSKSRLMGVGFVAAALAVAGVPPFSGFFSKFAIFAGGFEVGASHPLIMVLMVVALLESVGTFAWFLKWIGSVVLGAPSKAVAEAIEVPLSMRAVLVALIVMSICSSFIAATWLG
jgi:hydrogenase-4 component D